MHVEESVPAADRVELRFPIPVSTKRISRNISIHTGLIRYNNGAFKNAQFINGLDVFPVKWFINSSAVIDQHDNDRTAKQP